MPIKNSAREASAACSLREQLAHTGTAEWTWESRAQADSEACRLPAKEDLRGVRQRTPALLWGLPLQPHQGFCRFGGRGEDGQITKPRGHTGG